jgi:hypothetical protein
VSWYVQIKEIETGNVIKEIESGSESRAERVERGVQINLNHERFYTSVVEKQEGPDAMAG